MIQLKTDRQCKLIINNIVKACDNIDKLNGTGYNFIYLASGFIAHYNLQGFKYEFSKESLKDTILLFKNQNQWDNFRPSDDNYAYYMQRKEIYNAICNKLKGGAYHVIKESEAKNEINNI